jgi:hypothetical protein
MRQIVRLQTDLYHPPDKRVQNHSLLKDLTGFANAARTLWKLTVKNAMTTAAKPAM